MRGSGISPASSFILDHGALTMPSSLSFPLPSPSPNLTSLSAGEPCCPYCCHHPMSTVPTCDAPAARGGLGLQQEEGTTCSCVATSGREDRGGWVMDLARAPPARRLPSCWVDGHQQQQVVFPHLPVQNADDAKLLSPSALLQCSFA